MLKEFYSRILAGALVLGSIVAGAQPISQYTVNASTGTYSPISGGTVLGSTSNDDEEFNGSTSDSNVGTGFPIGFNFTYEGTTYSTFAVSSNGFITLGTGASFTIGGSTGGVLTSTTSNVSNLISAFNDDLESTSSGELSYALVGTAPNRELVVQWSNYTFYFEQDVLNFQIRLKEGSNQVVFAYGSIQNDADANVTNIGIRGDMSVSTSEFLVRTGADLANSSAGTALGDEVDIPANYTLAAGYTLTYTPGVSQSIDTRLLSLIPRLDDATLCANGTGAPTLACSVVFQNSGSTPLSSLPLTLTVGSQTINQTVTLSPALAQGERDTVVLSIPNFTTSGAIAMVAYHSLAGDAARSNDTTRASISLSDGSNGLFEDFSGAFPSNWTRSSSSSTYPWTTAPSPLTLGTISQVATSVVGNGFLYFNSNGAPAGATARLETQCIGWQGLGLGATDSLVLELLHATTTDFPARPDSVVVSVIPQTGAGNAVRVGSFIRQNANLGEGALEYRSFDLRPAVGTSPSFRLVLEAYSIFGRSIAIDYLRIRRGGPLGLNKALASRFQLFPNPARQQATLRLPQALDQATTLTLSDLSGKALLTQTLATGTQEATLSLAQLAPGVYQVSLSNGSARRVEKLVVE